MDQERIRCVFMRGGTSRGAYLLEGDLPRDPVVRDQVLLAIYGSPDRRQIDGIGGADPLTSKVAIVGRSRRPDADVDYTFGQVSITTPLVDYNSSCGNMAAGIGPFAVDEGLVPADEPITRVRIYHTNIRKIIVAEVPVRDGKAVVEGDCRIAGVPGSGARILLDFQDVGGTTTGRLLPTGRSQEELQVNGRSLSVSIVDAAVPVVFVRAQDVGMTGTELPSEIMAQPDLLARLEEIRSRAAERIGIVGDWHQATEQTPSSPKVHVVSPRTAYRTVEGEPVSPDDIDLVGRAMAMQKPHGTYAVTGGICAGVAARIPGTVVNEVCAAGAGDRIRIGHPAGTIAFEIGLGPRGDDFAVTRAALERTARRLMDGYVFVPRSRFVPGAIPLIRQETRPVVD